MKIAFRGQRPVWMLALFLIAAMAHADPENFVVDQFTFIRPPAWKWIWDEKLSKKGNLLEVPNENTPSETAPVFFWKFPEAEGSPAKRITAWQGYFHESPEDLHMRSSTNKIGAFEITYVEIQGTYVKVPHPDHALIGAIIKLKTGDLAIRMSGRSKLVEDSRPAFKEMIEQAVREKESE